MNATALLVALVAGLPFGSRPRVGPQRTHVAAEARQPMRDLGILLFIGEAGLRAGDSLSGTGLGNALTVLASEAPVTVASVLLPHLITRRVFALRPVEA